MSKYFIDFSGKLAPELIDRAGLLSSPVQVDDRVRIGGIFDDIQRSAGAHSEFSRPACSLLLQLLSLRIAELTIDGPIDNPRSLHTYKSCRELIDQRYTTLSSLNEIAATAHADPATICRLFKRFANTTPYRYLMRKKMTRAAELLQHSDLLIKQVAAELGFDDPFHFSRAFKRIHGSSPRRFIALNRRH